MGRKKLLEEQKKTYKYNNFRGFIFYSEKEWKILDTISKKAGFDDFRTYLFFQIQKTFSKIEQLDIPCEGCSEKKVTKTINIVDEEIKSKIRHLSKMFGVPQSSILRRISDTMIFEELMLLAAVPQSPASRAPL